MLYILLFLQMMLIIHVTDGNAATYLIYFYES